MAAKEGVYSDSYFTAAGEHLKNALLLHRHGRYALVHYLTGLAVECHFRSIIAKKKLLFDENHDLKLLAKNGRYYDLVPIDSMVKVSRAISLISQRWRNSHRYRSEDAMRRFLKLHEMDRGVKGNILKASSSAMLEAAYEVVTRGAHHGIVFD